MNGPYSRRSLLKAAGLSGLALSATRLGSFEAVGAESPDAFLGAAFQRRATAGMTAGYATTRGRMPEPTCG